MARSPTFIRCLFGHRVWIPMPEAFDHFQRGKHMYGFSDVYPSLEHFWADKLKLRRSDRHDYKILGLHFDLEPKEDKSEQEVRLIVGIPVINGTTYPELQESATNLEAWLSKDEWFEFHDEYPRLYFGALAIDDTRESRITEFPEIEDLIAN